MLTSVKSDSAASCSSSCFSSLFAMLLFFPIILLVEGSFVCLFLRLFLCSGTVEIIILSSFITSLSENYLRKKNTTTKTSLSRASGQGCYLNFPQPTFKITTLFVLNSVSTKLLQKEHTKLDTMALNSNKIGHSNGSSMSIVQSSWELIVR